MYNITFDADLIQDNDLTDSEFRTFLALKHLANDNGVFRITNDWLGHFMGRHFKTVSKLKKSLESKGYIEKVDKRVFRIIKHFN